MRIANDFDYEKKLWGAHPVKVDPRYLGALRLRYCLQDLEGIKGRVLEVGCGGGGMARAVNAYRPDLELYGCDVSQRAIQAARSGTEGVIFALGDAAHLPFAPQSFDAVLMLDILEHLEEPDRALREANRVLKAKGLLHLFVPCEGSPHTMHGLFYRGGWRAKERYGGHIQRFTFSGLLALLGDQGFEVRNGRWSSHIINQAVDVSYFTWLALRGRNVPYSVEGYLESAEPGVLPSLVGLLKSGIAILSYVESTLLRRIPGAGVHLACYKRTPRG